MPKVKGLVKPGNIDVNHRPVINNVDGSHSTIYSATIPVGKDGSLWPDEDYNNAPAYALVPQIADGKFLTADGKRPDEKDQKAMKAIEDAARERYRKTGQHLGIFDSDSAANDYASNTHDYMPDGTDNQVFTVEKTAPKSNSPSQVISEFRRMYLQGRDDVSDQQIFQRLADPENFRAAFPEYKNRSDQEIGKLVASEAGKTDEGKGWLKTMGGDLVDLMHNMVIDKKLGFGKNDLTPPDDVLRQGSDAINKWQDDRDKQRRQVLADADKRRSDAGYSDIYRWGANVLQGLGLYDPSKMEQAAAEGHMGEVIGHAAADTAVASAPLVGEGLVKGAGWAKQSAAEALMANPEQARLQAMNVPPKSKQVIRATKEANAAAPYLKGSQDLADLQTRVKDAKQEVFKPYADAVQRAGQQAIDLEKRRIEISGELDTWRKSNPSDAQAVLQKGTRIRDLNNEYRQVTSQLDPMIRAEGINPTRTRATYGAIKGVERRIEGRATTLEGTDSGLRTMAQFDLTTPIKDLEHVGQGAKEIITGRGWWEQKPTDWQAREGFRTAGDKPDLTVAVSPLGQRQGPQVRGVLPSAPVVTPPPAPNMSTQGGPPAINIDPTTRAVRKGLLLPEHKEPLVTPAPGETPVEPNASTPSYRIVRDKTSGKFMKQYLTSGGGEQVFEPLTNAEVMKESPKAVTEAPTMTVPKDKIKSKGKK